MTRLAYLDCVGGLAGDMLVAALLDAGAPAEPLLELPARLGISAVDCSVTRVERQGVGATHVAFATAHDDRAARSWRAVRELLAAATLSATVRARSLAVFERLAAAEAEVHGVPVDDVHFHELGAVDTLMDVCGAAALLEVLEIDAISSSPLPLARGQVETEHGRLPLPAPATLLLLRGCPVYGVEDGVELVTPTGAALAAELVSSWGKLPPLTLTEVGAGAGTRELRSRANVVRVLIGESAHPPAQGDVVLVETNLDDFNPELVPDASAALFAAGAIDVWTVPAQMKKGRPGIVLAALARPTSETAVAGALLEHTSALGVRVARMARYELEREERSVAVDCGSVRVKVGLLDGRVVNVAPEHDDCAELARRTGRSVQSIWAAALAAAQEPMP